MRITKDKILRVEPYPSGIRLYVLADERAETDCLDFDVQAFDQVLELFQPGTRKGVIEEACTFLCDFCRDGNMPLRAENTSAVLWVHDIGGRLQRCAASRIREEMR